MKRIPLALIALSALCTVGSAQTMQTSSFLQKDKTALVVVDEVIKTVPFRKWVPNLSFGAGPFAGYDTTTQNAATGAAGQFHWPLGGGYNFGFGGGLLFDVGKGFKLSDVNWKNAGLVVTIGKSF